MEIPYTSCYPYYNTIFANMWSREEESIREIQTYNIIWEN